MAFRETVPGGPIMDAQTPTAPAPVDTDRSFLIAGAEHWKRLGAVAGVYVPVNDSYEPMSPIERSTGIVLPIIAEQRIGKTNRHHGYFYERTYATGTIGQQVVRSSRLQRVPIGAHQTYHDMFKGTALPKTEYEQNRQTILNCAGYVPASAVYIAADSKVSVIRMNERQKRELCKANVFTTEKESHAQMKIGQFLMYYALSQKLTDVAAADIHKFLSITPEMMADKQEYRDKKLHMAMRLTNIAIGLAVTPVNNQFEQARQRRALRLGTPRSAWEVVKRQIKNREPDYFETLENRLLQAA